MEGGSSSTGPFPEARVMEVNVVTFNTTEAEVKERRGEVFSWTVEKRVLLQVRDPMEVRVMIEEERVYCDNDEMFMLLRMAEPVWLSVMRGRDWLTWTAMANCERVREPVETMKKDWVKSVDRVRVVVEGREDGLIITVQVDERVTSEGEASFVEWLFPEKRETVKRELDGEEEEEEEV